MRAWCGVCDINVFMRPDTGEHDPRANLQPLIAIKPQAEAIDKGLLTTSASVSVWERKLFTIMLSFKHLQTVFLFTIISCHSHSLSLWDGRMRMSAFSFCLFPPGRDRWSRGGRSGWLIVGSLAHSSLSLAAVRPMVASKALARSLQRRAKR